MRSLGKILREQREKRGLSLDQLVNRTRISRKSLEALESDDRAALGSTFYFRSFARQVAVTLELDTSTAEWNEALSLASAASIPEPAPPAPDTYVPKVAPLRPQRQSRWRTATPVVSFVVVLVACSGLYAILDRIDLSDAAFFHGVLTSPPSQDADNRQFVNSPAQPVLHQPDAAGEVILLKIAAVEKTWLSVDTDGRHVYSGLLHAADTKELEGRATAKLKTGNAGGLTVTFNGKELGTLGERGQVRTVLFTRDRYRILAPDLTSRLQLLPAVTLPRWSR